jgi:fused signal recognition particle receptor
MFEGLKKKFSDAIRNFVKKEEREAETARDPAPEAGEKKGVDRVAAEPRNKEDKRGEERRIGDAEGETRAETIEAKKEERDIQIKVDTKREEPRGADEKKREDPLLKLSLKTKIKKAFMGSVVLSDQEIAALLETLKVSMLESDVAFDVAENFVEDLGARLRGKRIESREIRRKVTENVRGALVDVLEKATPSFELVQLVRQKREKPYVVLFLGPNGTGKTTTIAKIAKRLKENGLTSVLSASDTFRAAAIEQIDHHAKRLGIPIIKSTYGADPASIAFDAVAYGRAHRTDAVLVDTAGRQETNASLIREIEKMVRVSKPDLTLFVGEATAGNAIANQIVEFSKHVKVDGIILTKLDCDAKGGSTLSISHLTGIPILFFGIGEGYDALMDYNPGQIADVIMPGPGAS